MVTFLRIGLTTEVVIAKTDHPALNGRYLMYEAQQAHYYGRYTGMI